MYKLIKTDSELDEVRKLLLKFYTLRSNNYGHNTKTISDYRNYVDTVKKNSDYRTKLLDFGFGTAESLMRSIFNYK